LELHLPPSTLELSGLVANQSKRSETSLIVVHAGLSLLSRPCLTESASPLTKRIRLESQLLTFSPAALTVDMAALAVTQIWHSPTGRTTVLSQETSLEITLGASHIPSSVTPLVILPVLLRSIKLQFAKSPATLSILLSLTMEISTSQARSTVLPEPLTSLTRSLLMDQLLLLLPSMRTSIPTRPVSISTHGEVLSEVTLSSSSGMVPRTEPIIGLSPTHGTSLGEKVVSSELLEELTTAELRIKYMPDSQRLTKFTV